MIVLMDSSSKKPLLRPRWGALTGKQANMETTNGAKASSPEIVRGEMPSTISATQPGARKATLEALSVRHLILKAHTSFACNGDYSQVVDGALNNNDSLKGEIVDYFHPLGKAVSREVCEEVVSNAMGTTTKTQADLAQSGTAIVRKHFGYLSIR